MSQAPVRTKRIKYIDHKDKKYYSKTGDFLILPLESKSLAFSLELIIFLVKFFDLKTIPSLK